MADRIIKRLTVLKIFRLLYPMYLVERLDVVGGHVSSLEASSK